MSRFAMFPKSRRMLTCRAVGKALQAYLDGEADELTVQRIDHHLEACRRCGMDVAVYTDIKQALHRSGQRLDREAVERLRSYGDRLIGGRPS